MSHRTNEKRGTRSNRRGEIFDSYTGLVFQRKVFPLRFVQISGFGFYRIGSTLVEMTDINFKKAVISLCGAFGIDQR